MSHTIKIVSRYDSARVLYQCDVTDEQHASGIGMRVALENATVAGADLRGADLTGAYLRDADLTGADLRGAYLIGANLDGTRPILQIGPIGSRCSYLVSYITDAGVMVRAGCFYGTLDEFRAAVEKTHGESDHGREYQMAMLMIEAHAAIWTPKKEESK